MKLGRQAARRVGGLRAVRRSGGRIEGPSVLPFVRFAFLLLCSLLPAGFSSPVLAQIPDSLTPDSVQADTVDETARFLEAERAARVPLNVLPLVGVGGPRAPLSRIVITRDTIDWGIAESVGDLLQRVPGVYLWRGGWFGRPEYPDYQGRGATSVEYYLDGLPYLPMGPDSLGTDPALFPLSFLERIEIDRWPGYLRVHLFTWRRDRLAARSRIGIASGDKSIARYIGSLERRFQNGLGFVVAGEYFDAPTGSGFASTHTNTHYRLQLGWVPSPKFGVQAQSIRMSPVRRPYERAAGDTIGAGQRGDRADEQVRVFYRPSGTELGLRTDLIYGHSRWRGSGVDQSFNQVGALASFRTPTADLGGSVFYRSRWTGLDARANAGWAGIRGFTLSGEIVYQRHDENRESRWTGAQAGLALPLGFTLAGAARLGKVVAAPAVLTDSAQDLTDLSAHLGFHSRPVTLEIGIARTDAFRPFVPQPFLLIDSLRPPGRTDWLTVSGRIAPLQWLTIEGWYSDPMGASVDGIPPTHSYVTGTIRSQFLRKFPSGIFDLKLQLGMEAWSSGTIGVDGTGTPIELGGATFFRSQVQIRLGRLIIFWDRINLNGEKRSFVPEYFVPRFGSTFGARWEFVN
ncbi:MAG: TonB-dependent receptor plug domain-containing protein [Gemmatimonadales bacterium]